MNFLHPWGLALLGLAAVPVLLHLLHREIRQRVCFPALRYLQSSQREHARSVRLRDLLLLALRLAMLILVALVAAGPLIGRGGAGDHRPTDVALVIDNTASMSRMAADRSQFDRQLERARITLEAAGPQDRFWVFPVVGAETASGTGAGEALAALGRTSPTDAAGAPLEKARAAWLALPVTAGREREVHLLSDLQASGFGERALDEDQETTWVVPASPAAEPNGALSDLQISTGVLTVAGLDVDLTATPTWTGAPPQIDSVTIRLETDARTEALVTANWGDDAVFRLAAPGLGVHSGKLQIPPSGLRSDDARYFALRVEAAPSVVRYGPPGSFVARALATLREAGRLGRGAPTISIVEGDAAVLPSRVGGRTKSGGVGERVLVLLPPLDPLLLSRFNQWLAEAGVPESLRADPTPGQLRLKHSTLFRDGGGVSVTRRYRLAEPDLGTATSRQILLRTEDELPWLVRGEREDLLYLLAASPLDPEATDLPILPAMIPFIEALVLRWSHGEAWPTQQVEAGSTLLLPPGADSISLAGQRARRVDGGLPFTPLRAGVYSVYRTTAGQQRTDALAVNVPTSESDLRAVSDTDLERLLGGRLVRAGSSVNDWRRTIYQSRRGSDIGPWLLIGVFLLALAEVLVASPRLRATERSGIGSSGAA